MGSSFFFFIIGRKIFIEENSIGYIEERERGTSNQRLNGEEKRQEKSQSAQHYNFNGLLGRC